MTPAGARSLGRRRPLIGGWLAPVIQQPAGLGAAEPIGLLGVGPRRDPVAAGQVGDRSVIQQPAAGSGVGLGVQRAGVISDRLGQASRLVGQDAPVQPRGRQVRGQLQGAGISAGGVGGGPGRPAPAPGCNGRWPSRAPARCRCERRRPPRRTGPDGRRTGPRRSSTRSPAVEPAACGGRGQPPRGSAHAAARGGPGRNAPTKSAAPGGPARPDRDADARGARRSPGLARRRPRPRPAAAVARIGRQALAHDIGQRQAAPSGSKAVRSMSPSASISVRPSTAAGTGRPWAADSSAASRSGDIQPGVPPSRSVTVWPAAIGPRERWKASAATARPNTWAWATQRG